MDIDKLNFIFLLLAIFFNLTRHDYKQKRVPSPIEIVPASSSLLLLVLAAGVSEPPAAGTPEKNRVT